MPIVLTNDEPCTFVLVFQTLAVTYMIIVCEVIILMLLREDHSETHKQNESV